MELVGYRRSSFPAKDTGEVISGYNLFLTGVADNVVGVAVERVFLSDRKLGDYKPQLGDTIELVYNRYGKVGSIRVIAAA